MAYCTQADIEAEFKGITFSASGTVVTTTQLAEFIDQESTYIDARAGLRYVMPVLSASYPDAYKILKRICIFRVSQRVKNKMEVKREETQKSSEEKYIQNKVMTPNDDLDLIVKGLLLLKNVPLAAKNGGVNSFNVSTCVKHVFDTTKQQW
jgi:hypothetical protein